MAVGFPEISRKSNRSEPSVSLLALSGLVEGRTAREKRDRDQQGRLIGTFQPRKRGHLFDEISDIGHRALLFSVGEVLPVLGAIRRNGVASDA
jgi:hypothetical protein